MSDGRHYWNRRWGKSLTLSLFLCIYHLPLSLSLSLLSLSSSQCLPASLGLKATEPLNERLHCFSTALKTRFLSLLASDLWAKSNVKIDTDISVLSTFRLDTLYITLEFTQKVCACYELWHNVTNMLICLLCCKLVSCWREVQLDKYRMPVSLKFEISMDTFK